MSAAPALQKRTMGINREEHEAKGEGVTDAYCLVPRAC